MSQKNFSFFDAKGIEYSYLDTLHLARVYVFLSPECPLCQSYTSTLKQIQMKYAASGVELIGVISGTIFTETSISNFINKYQISFPIVVDSEKILAKTLQASITPEVFVVDNEIKTRYSGRIDDWAYAIGKKRKNISDHSLINALEEIISSRPVSLPVTRAIGCFLE